MPRGRRSNPSRSWSNDPQVLANGYVGVVEIDGGESYRLPAVPVQFDEAPPGPASCSRARRAHRGDSARARPRLGPHHRAQDRRDHSVTTARPLPVPDEQSAPFWSAAADHVLTWPSVRTASTYSLPPECGVRPLRLHRPGVRLRSGLPGPASCARSRSFARHFCRASTTTSRSSSSMWSSTCRPDLRLIGRLVDGVEPPPELGEQVEIAWEDLTPEVAVPAFRRPS